MDRFEALVRLTAGALAGNPDIAPEAAARNAEKALKRIEKAVESEQQTLTEGRLS